MMTKIFGKPNPKIRLTNTNPNEIEKIINSLQSKNSYGYDKVSMKILKTSTLFIISHLNYICNKAISTGIFPSCLQYSVVKPLYKKGDKKDVANYRQILVLPSFSEILQKVIFNRLLAHFNNNNIRVYEQFGF